MAETNGAIYGIVSEEGAVKVNNAVVLMDHTSLFPIAKTYTDQYGGYMFNNLDPHKTDYMVFTIDNDGVEPKNALIKDYVQPVTSASGALGGNFLGALDALAPTMSGVPIYRAGQTVAGCVVARPHGGAHAVGQNVDWNGYQTYSDNTATPPDSACPIPSNPLIRAMKHTAGWSGWTQRPLRFEFFEKRLAYDYAEAPKISANAPLSIFITHKTDPSGPMTYSVTHQMRPARSEVYSQPRYNVNGFYPDESDYYATDCFFNVCIEADHTLRLKWLVDNNGVPVSASKRNILVTTLDAGKWYAVMVRIGNFAAPTKVDVCDIAAGTVVTYEVAAIVSINKHKNYGSGWATGEPRRTGFRISGPHNQAVNNTFNTWNTSTCWSWVAFSAGNGYSGPWATWNRQVSDAESAFLMRSIYDVGAFRSVPRGVSEIMKYAPVMYLPLDEYPGNVPRIVKQGARLPLSYAGCPIVDEPAGVFSLRRRQVVRIGEGARIRPVALPHSNTFTVVAFLYQPVVGGAGPLVNLVQQGGEADTDCTGNATYHVMHLALESNGRPRAYWRSNADAYYDKYFGTSSPAVDVGHHMIAWVFDLYNGLKITAYVDGVLQGTSSQIQQQMDCHVTGIASNYYAGSDMGVGFGFQINASPSYNAGAFTHSLMGVVRGTVIPTDIAFYTGGLDQAAITELWEAYQIAIGPDSHE